ncbi:hypothetical protein EON65_27120 [archaeon]|nr:MAG: hypothetical protein EON65_27120 [archaeon]
MRLSQRITAAKTVPVTPNAALEESLSRTIKQVEDDGNDSASSCSLGEKDDIITPANKSTATGLRRYSLADMMSRKTTFYDPSEAFVWNPASDQITVGDIVRVMYFERTIPEEGIVIEKINQYKLKVDFGEHVKECLLEDCALLMRGDEFEVGDKVEARPQGSSLFFVGRVIKVHEDKSIDVLMDGDDPNDIEYGIAAEDARKLMSRRSVVVNRWKKAFMMVVATNLFKRITFHSREQK